MTIRDNLSRFAEKNAKSRPNLADLTKAAFIIWIVLVYGFYIVQFVSEPVLVDRLLALLSGLLQ